MKINNIYEKAVLLIVLLLSPCVAAFADGTFDPTSYAQMLMQNIDYFNVAMQAFSVVAGICLFASGIHGLQKFGQQRSSMSPTANLIGPFTKLVGGVALLGMATFVNSVIFAFFGNASPEVNPFDSSDSLAMLYEPILMIVRVIGLGVFIKMIFTFAKAGGHNPPPGTIGKGMVYLLGSILCIHIQTTCELVGSFFGVTFPF